MRDYPYNSRLSECLLTGPSAMATKSTNEKPVCTTIKSEPPQYYDSEPSSQPPQYAKDSSKPSEIQRTGKQSTATASTVGQSAATVSAVIAQSSAAQREGYNRKKSLRERWRNWKLRRERDREDDEEFRRRGGSYGSQARLNVMGANITDPKRKR